MASCKAGVNRSDKEGLRMNFAGILILTALVLVGGILFVGLGYAIFAPVTAESIRKLKKELEIKP